MTHPHHPLLAVLLAVALLTPLTSDVLAGDPHPDDPDAPPVADLTQRVTTAQVLLAVEDAFPEAHAQFTEVTFARLGDHITPARVAFLVPARHTDLLDDEENLKNRGHALIKAIHHRSGKKLPERSPCMTIRADPAKDYGWRAWRDRRVRKVVLHTNYAC